MYLVDSHCHLDMRHMDFPLVPAENDDITDEVIQRALNAQVAYMLNIGTKLSDVQRLQAISDKYDCVFRTVGIHPLEADSHVKEYSDDDVSDIIKSQCAMAKTVGIGEIGLDYHYDSENRDAQIKLFHLQLEQASALQLPVSIHSRDAYEDTINILQDHGGVTGVMHCFSGGREFAREILDLGYFISISGIVTYKNAAELRDVVKYIPLNRLLVETDAPFLAPVPNRGKMNEPAFVTYTAKQIADVLQVDPSCIAEHTSRNFFTLFSKVGHK